MDLGTVILIIIGLVGVVLTFILVVLAFPSARNEWRKWRSKGSRREFPFETLTISELPNKVNTVLRDLPFMERPKKEKRQLFNQNQNEFLLLESHLLERHSMLWKWLRKSLILLFFI